MPSKHERAIYMKKKEMFVQYIPKVGLAVLLAVDVVVTVVGALPGEQ